MKKFLRMVLVIIASTLMAFGLAVTPARAAVHPEVHAVENANGSYIVVDATKSDANLQTPMVNSKFIVESSGGTWAWAQESTYYPQKMNTYEVSGHLAGWLKWRIVDTRDPSIVIAAGTIDGRFPEERVVDVYSADGYYEVNGRQWMTWCEPYSQTERCHTDIWATQAQEVAPGIYANVNGWVFNNLTYLPSTRSLWANNPLGGYGEYGYEGSWTAEDGRQWRVQCDTSLSGRGGCRADIKTTVIEHSSGSFRQVDKWLFNNLVRFD